MLQQPRSFFILIAILAMCVFAADKPADPATKLLYMAEEYPPANFTKDGQVTGLSVEVLKAVWKKMGIPEQPIYIVPWARGYSDVQTKPGTVLFTMSRQEARETLFAWVGPIFASRHNLVSLKSRGLKLNSLADARKYITAVIRDDISEVSLKAQGFTDKELVVVARQPQAIELLISGRADFVFISQDGLLEWAEANGKDIGLFQESFLVNEIKQYYAFHKSTPPDLIARFQKALEGIRDEHIAILKKYGVHL